LSDIQSGAHIEIVATQDHLLGSDLVGEALVRDDRQSHHYRVQVVGIPVAMPTYHRSNRSNSIGKVHLSVNLVIQAR